MPESSQKNTGMAAIAYILFFVPLLTDAKNDPFVKFHVKQGLVLFIGYVIGSFVYFIPIVPIVGWIVAVALLVLFIIGFFNALGGKEIPLPVIGDFAKNFKI